MAGRACGLDRPPAGSPGRRRRVVSIGRTAPARRARDRPSPGEWVGGRAGDGHHRSVGLSSDGSGGQPVAPLNALLASGVAAERASEFLQVGSSCVTTQRCCGRRESNGRPRPPTRIFTSPKRRWT